MVQALALQTWHTIYNKSYALFDFVKMLEVAAGGGGGAGEVIFKLLK